MWAAKTSCVRRDVALKCPLLAVMLKHETQGTFLLDYTEDGTIFIDRDGDLFYILLQFLRSGQVPTKPKDSLLIRRLRREFAYFGLVYDVRQFFIGFRLACMCVCEPKHPEIDPKEDPDGHGDNIVWHDSSTLPFPNLMNPISTSWNGLLYVFNRTEDFRLHCFNPISEQWTLCDTCIPETFASTCAVHADSLFILDEPDNSTLTLQRLCLSSGQWDKPLSTPIPNGFYTLAIIGSTLYVGSFRVGDTVWAYSISENCWSTLPKLVSRQSGRGLCSWKDNLYIAGGTVMADSKSVVPTNNVLRMDTAKPGASWEPVCPLTKFREKVSVTSGCDGIYASSEEGYGPTHNRALRCVHRHMDRTIQRAGYHMERQCCRVASLTVYGSSNKLLTKLTKLGIKIAIFLLVRKTRPQQVLLTTTSKERNLHKLEK